MGTHEHKKGAPKRLIIGIISVSSSRTIENDKSGLWIKKCAGKEGHDVVFHRVVKDEISMIVQAVRDSIRLSGVQSLLITGGTGLSKMDVTIEAVRPMFDKELTAFSSIFAQLSFEQIDSAAIVSRATAGTIGNTVVFCMPGSINACKLSCRDLIFPELGHIVKHLIKG